MNMFEVQDSLLLLDLDPTFLFNPSARDAAERSLEVGFEPFVSYLRTEHPNSRARRFVEASQGFEGSVVASTVEESQCWKQCIDLAMEGYAPAAFLLYYIYDTGMFGVQRDPAKSKHFEDYAGELGHPQALWNAGIKLSQANPKAGNSLILRSALLGFSAAIQYIRDRTEVFGDLEAGTCFLECKYDF